MAFFFFHRLLIRTRLIVNCVSILANATCSLVWFYLHTVESAFAFVFECLREEMNFFPLPHTLILT